VSIDWIKWFIAVANFFSKAALNLVTSFAGRVGAITPQAGDYPPALGGTGQTDWEKGDLLIGSGTNLTALLTSGPDGSVLTSKSSAPQGVDWELGSAATNLTMPGEFTVSGSGTGTITVSSAVEAANYVWSGPASGSAAPPTFKPIDVVVSSFLNFFDAEAPAGTVDGVNTTFTLANSPNPPLSLQLFLNAGGAGNYILQNGLYTLAGNTITYTTAPIVGSTHLAWYRA
jgi:hypothetical protein